MQDEQIMNGQQNVDLLGYDEQSEDEQEQLGDGVEVDGEGEDSNGDSDG